MTQVTLYHNPRCSKSRQTLALLQDNGHDVTIREYLKNPPSIKELGALLKKLDYAPRELLRTNETIYKELKLSDNNLNDATLIQHMGR